MQTSTLRPGLLVALKTAIKGNVSYVKTDIDHRETTGGTFADTWETTRFVTDPEELERAKKARSKVISLIRSACATSGFGLLCPQSAEQNLEACIREARQVVDRFNTFAQSTNVNMAVMIGRIASDDLEAVKAINSEVRDLLTDMAEGVKALDPVAIREAANKARSLGAMLSPQAKANVQTAIDSARRVARDIVKAGEQATIEVDNQVLAKLDNARMAFLDLEEPSEPTVMPEADAGHAVDLDPEVITLDDTYAALDKAMAERDAASIDPNWEL